MKTIQNIFFILLVSFSFSCRKGLELNPPPTELAASTVFESDQTALSALSGIYANLMLTEFGICNSGVTMYTGLAADEFSNYIFGDYPEEFFNNSLTPNNYGVESLWTEAYKNIYAVNAILIGIEKSQSLTVEVKKQIAGESRFIRALLYFYLVNLYGDIPIPLSTDYIINSSIKRSASSDVYKQIITDLKESINFLGEDYPSAGRVRPNKWTAVALLSRVCLYTRQWNEAATYSSELIENAGIYSLLTDLNGVFAAGSEETIWALAPVIPERNTNEGYYFILEEYPAYVSLRNSILDSFETGDNRRSAWVSDLTIDNEVFYFPFKYKVKYGDGRQEDQIQFRLAEQFLIRAEAKAQSGDLTSAVADLNVIRNRAGLADSNALSEEEILAAIEHEREIELLAEAGHRWFDLKRTNRANTILEPIKSPAWHPTDVIFPIPSTQILYSPTTTQNPGY